MSDIKKRKRGPVLLPDELKRTHFVRVYFTNAEISEVRARAKHLKLTVFVRWSALDRTSDPVISVPEINLSAYTELGRIGINLNQIARRLNASEQVDTTDLSIELTALVEAHERLLGAFGSEDDSI